jgi:hypothetical protein
MTTNPKFNNMIALFITYNFKIIFIALSSYIFKAEKRGFAKKRAALKERGFWILSNDNFCRQ